MLDRILTIWRKELMDFFRDRKSIRNGLFSALLIGVFYAVFNPLLTASFAEQAQDIQIIATIGVENATPEFITAMETSGIILEPYAGDLRADVERGEIGAGLIIPEDFAGKVSAEQVASLTLLTNPSAGGIFSPNFSGERLQIAINVYNQSESARRVEVRGVDAALLTPINLSAENLITPAQRAGLFASFSLPFIVAFLVAQSGMAIAIDVTAGEKERGTLEALLVTPASDVEVFVGKLLSVFTFSMIPLTLTFAAFYIASLLLPESARGDAVLPFSVIVTALVVSIPLVLFINVVIMILCIRTRGYKEAQTAAGIVTFAATVVGFVVSFLPPSGLEGYLIPMYGPAAVVSKVALSAPVPALALPLCILGSLIAAGVGVFIAQRFFNRERMLYGV